MTSGDEALPGIAPGIVEQLHHAMIRRQPVWARLLPTLSPGIAPVSSFLRWHRGFLFYMELQIIIRLAAELGAIQALISAGKLKPYLKKSEAFKLYGRKKVERWINEGLITPRKDGDHSACWRIDRMEAEAIAKAEQLLQFL